MSPHDVCASAALALEHVKEPVDVIASDSPVKGVRTSVRTSVLDVDIEPSTHEELAAFTGALEDRYESLQHAFEDMLRFVGLPAFTTSISLGSWERAVTQHLQYTSPSSSRSLFRALDPDASGRVSCSSLAAFSRDERMRGLMTSTDFRLQLLSQFPNLVMAFRHLEKVLGEVDRAGGICEAVHHRKRSLGREDFVHALCQAFSISAAQAEHFFRVMDKDGNGSVSMREWIETLTRCPLELLMQDLRCRILQRYASIGAALAGHASHVAETAPLSREVFADILRHLAVVAGAEVDAIFDRLAVASGCNTVSIQALREGLRDQAPRCSLAVFFERIWVVAGCDSVVPMLHMVNVPAEESVETSIGSASQQRRMQWQSWRQPRSSIVHGSPVVTRSVFVEKLCLTLDVSRENSADIWNALGGNSLEVACIDFIRQAESYLPATDADHLRLALLRRFGSLRQAFAVIIQSGTPGCRLSQNVDGIGLDKMLKEHGVHFSGSCVAVLDAAAGASLTVTGGTNNHAGAAGARWGNIQRLIEGGNLTCSLHTARSSKTVVTPGHNSSISGTLRIVAAPGSPGGSPRRRRRAAARGFVRTQLAPLRREVARARADMGRQLSPARPR